MVGLVMKEVRERLKEVKASSEMLSGGTSDKDIGN